MAGSCPGLTAQTTLTVRPKEIDDVLTNPGVGFTTFQRFNGDALNTGETWTEGYPIVYQKFDGNLANANYPMTSIAYFRIYWRFLEPEKGKYRWDLIDIALRTAHDRKQTLMLRVAPYGTKDDNDVPDWYRKMVGDETGSKLNNAKWRTDPEDPRYARDFGDSFASSGNVMMATRILRASTWRSLARGARAPEQPIFPMLLDMLSWIAIWILSTRRRW